MYTLKQLASKYPEKFVVCKVAFRNGQNDIAVAFDAIATCDTEDEVRSVLSENQDYFGVSTKEEDLPPDLAALMYRRILHCCS